MWLTSSLVRCPSSAISLAADSRAANPLLPLSKQSSLSLSLRVPASYAMSLRVLRFVPLLVKHRKHVQAT